MVGIDGGIGAVPLGFRCKGIYKPPADEPPENRQKKEYPSVENRLCGFKKMPLTRGRRGAISSKLVQQEVGSDLTEKMKKNGPKTGDKTDQDKIKAPFPHRSDDFGLFL